jgi:hypothetical protein
MNRRLRFLVDITLALFCKIKEEKKKQKEKKVKKKKKKSKPSRVAVVQHQGCRAPRDGQLIFPTSKIIIIAAVTA